MISEETDYRKDTSENSDGLVFVREDMGMIIRKIVITGGPCAGKTTALSWIQNAFTKRGYRVLFVPETATELITGGVAPWTCGTNLDFQKCQVRLQVEKEAVFLRAAKTMDADKVLIVCDRGVLDNRAYMSKKEWQEVLKDFGSNEIDLRDGYDAVFHMVTAAKGAVEAYTTANNAARYETVEQAAEMDDKDTRRVEVEQRLTQDDYLKYLMDADTTARPIRKTRYCLAQDHFYFEIDVYPEWTKQAVLEIEIRDEGEKVTFPEGIEIIREVTGDSAIRTILWHTRWCRRMKSETQTEHYVTLSI